MSNTDTEALHAAVCQAVSIMNQSFDIAASKDGRKANDILRQALIDYADMTDHQTQHEVRPLVWMPVIGHPLAIRAALLSETQAKANHGQTLAQLAERGGLSLDEAAALALRRKWAQMTADAALAALVDATKRHWPHESTATT